MGKEQAVPFLLEDRLKELGGQYMRGPDWHPFAGNKQPRPAAGP